MPAAGAEAVRDAIVAQLDGLPPLLRRSLTWDQGSELAQHAQLKLDADIDIYFCDPHSPWQRGSNENTNGLLRQYFPRGTDLSRHSRDDLDAVVLALNTRPRKTLAWRTPGRGARSAPTLRRTSWCLPRPLETAQFRSRAFRAVLAHGGLVGSIGRVASAGDNAAMESFFALLQTNVLDRHSWATRDELRVAIVTWIERTYNRRRRQRRLGRLTPVEFELALSTRQPQPPAMSTTTVN